MNTLYSILTQGTQFTEGNYYIKSRYSIVLSDRMVEIRNALLPSVSGNRLAFVSCVLCWMTSESGWAQELRETDSMNTYSKPPRLADEILGETALVCHDWLKPEDIRERLLPLLDADLRDALALGLPYDAVCAGCIQLLREVSR